MSEQVPSKDRVAELIRMLCPPGLSIMQHQREQTFSLILSGAAIQDIVAMLERYSAHEPEVGTIQARFARLVERCEQHFGIEPQPYSSEGPETRIWAAMQAASTPPPAPALRPDGMPEPSLDVLKRVATRMRTDAPDSAYLVEWAAEQMDQLTVIARAARNVCTYDWSDNDDDAVATIDRLHAVVGPWLARSTSTKGENHG